MNRPRKTARHLPPCVYEKHGAYWYVKRGKWERLGSDLPTALAEYGRRLEGEATGGMPELIDRVYAEHTPKLAENTRKQYRRAADTLKRKLKQFAPDQVKGKHIAGIKQSMADNPPSANHALSFLRVVFTYAVEWQLVESNPCFGVKPYSLKARTRYVTDAEYQAIYSKAGERLQIVMDLCYSTGQRISDVLGLRVQHLGDDGIFFKAKKTENSTQVQFVVAWTPELRVAVDRAKALQGSVRCLSLLKGRSNKPPTYRTVVGQWWEACKAAGVEDANLHDLRAKSLTDASRQGKDATALAGHADAKMTERYIRLRETPVVSGPSFRRLIDSAAQS